MTGSPNAEARAVDETPDPFDCLCQKRAYDDHDVGGPADVDPVATERALAGVAAEVLVLAPALDLYNPGLAEPSMGTVGDAYDNAMAESFFASLECELINRRSWRSQAEARTALFTWIEGWYNPRRRHSGLNYLSPINFERKYVQQKDHSEEHGLPTAAAGSSQAPTAAVDNPAPVQSSA